MIDVLFFARLREELGVDRMQLTYEYEIKNIHDIIARIRDLKGIDFADKITAECIITAHNQKIVKGTFLIEDGDEIAFFPPVSGG